MRSIIEPDLMFSAHRFPLSSSKLEVSLDEICKLGITSIIQSKQFLEDCIENRTDLIAIQGELNYKEKSFEFSAQFDVKGFGLYVSGLSSTKEGKELQVILENAFK